MKLLFKSVSILTFYIIFPFFLNAQDNQEELFNTLERADAYFASGDYINAKATYQVALKMAPEDAYAKDRLQQSLDMIKVQMQQNALYAEKVLQADELYKKNDLENALRIYKMALEDLPGDAYANDRVKEIEKTFADAAKLEEDYKISIANGDKLLAAGNLQGALGEYKKASSLKPQEGYPGQKVSEVEAMIAEQKSVAGSYEKAMADAELAIQRKKFDEAILQLENASNLKPDASEPKTKMAEVRQLKSEYESYASIIENADNLYIEKDFEKAKSEYQKALAIKPDDEYPKSMLDKIGTALMDISTANKSSYDVAIARADELYNEQEYEQAMVEYNNALRFQPDQQYAQQRISDINNTLSFKKSQDEAYAQSISRADQLFKEERYVESMEEYNKAIGFRPMEQYPKVKIDEIKTIQANLQNQRQIYSSLISGADKLYFADDYEEARDQYRKASDMFPKEQYPLDQIKMINEILGQRDMYTKAVAEADKLMYEKRYSEALAEYRKAAALNENEVYAQGRIYEIETMIAEEEISQAAQRKYDSVLFEADSQFEAGDYITAMETYKTAQAILPTQGYPEKQMEEINSILARKAQQEALEKQYTEAIASADKLLAAKDYQNARAAYENASALKPEEAYPGAKIDEINEILGDIAAKEAFDKQYAEALAKADELLLAKDYQNALAAYQSAASMKPGETYPGQKIGEINTILGEVAAKEALEKQYGDVISNADDLLANKDYTNALAAYKAALNLKSGEAYPQEKINEIKAILEEIASMEALDKQYSEAIAKADQLMSSKDYMNAILAFEAAGKIKPTETLHSDKIIEINAILDEVAAKEALEKQYAEAIEGADKLLAVKDYQNALIAYQNASAIKPGEEYPSVKIAEINGILGEIAAREALDKQYAETIANADQLLLSKNYTNALAAYKSAQSLKPSEKYPGDKIAEINKALEDIAAKEALENQFAQLISEAEGYFNQQNYSEAKAKYEAAALLKPSDPAIKTRMAEIDVALAELAKKAEEDRLYAEAIAFGDKHFANMDYENARREYLKAAGIKVTEQFPLQKIAEIDAIEEGIRKQKELDTQYNKAIASADQFMTREKYEEARFEYQEAIKIKPGEKYPEAQIAEINRKLESLAMERDQAYQVALGKADNYLEQQEYKMAKVQYERAIEIKPDEVYPLDKLKIVNEQIMKQRQIMQEEYDKSIADADKYYASKLYDNAIEAYQASSVINPEEEYPKEMIRRILKMLSERSIVQINKDPLLIANNTQHKFEFFPVPVKDRKSNYIFFRAKNVSPNEYKLIINFGKDQAKNGGVVLRVPAGADLKEFIVRISAQYKWFSDDNNWITFYPEGGDLEVSLLQISYSD